MTQKMAFQNQPINHIPPKNKMEQSYEIKLWQALKMRVAYSENFDSNFRWESNVLISGTRGNFTRIPESGL